MLDRRLRILRPSVGQADALTTKDGGILYLALGSWTRSVPPLRQIQSLLQFQISTCSKTTGPLVWYQGADPSKTCGNL